MSQHFASAGQSSGVSALTSDLPMNTQDGLVGSPCSPKDSQESSQTPQFKSIRTSALSFFIAQLSHEAPGAITERPQGGRSAGQVGAQPCQARSSQPALWGPQGDSRPAPCGLREWQAAATSRHLQVKGPGFGPFLHLPAGLPAWPRRGTVRRRN